MGGGGGESSSKSVTRYKPAISYMPEEMQQQTKQAISGYFQMPSSIPIGYDGNIYPMVSKGPLYGAQAATQLFSPQTSWSGSKQEQWQAPSFCGMSCFMFVEAERDEKLKELRWFRDSHFPKGCTVQSGYSKMSRFIIPLMRKSKLFKWFIKLIMTSPLIVFAKWYYKKNRYGIMFYPLAWMWRNVWWTIGKFVPMREYTWEEFYAITGEKREEQAINDILYSANI